MQLRMQFHKISCKKCPKLIDAANPQGLPYSGENMPASLSTKAFNRSNKIKRGKGRTISIKELSSSDKSKNKCPIPNPAFTTFSTRVTTATKCQTNKFVNNFY